MIWLTWRQFRVQAVAVVAALIVLAIYLVTLGFQIRHSYQTDIVGCQPANCDSAMRSFADAYGGQISGIGALLIGFPALIGIFWGAPLIAREFEEGTHRLVWNQSVTRNRWLAIKLGFIALVSVTATGLFSVLLTWSASRYDQLLGDRFEALSFDSRNIVPLGYAAFAFVLGTVIGLLVRRTLPAMALTLAIFAIMQILISTEIRAHLMSPVNTIVDLDAAAMKRLGGFRVSETDARVQHFSFPGAWSLATESQLLNADGTSYNAKQATLCMTGSWAGDQACMVKQNLHFSYTYQPASRYWSFQWIELSGFLVLTMLLIGFGFWWIRKRPS